MSKKNGFKAKNKKQEFFHEVFTDFCEDTQNPFQVHDYEWDIPKPTATIIDEDGNDFKIGLHTVAKAFAINEKNYPGRHLALNCHISYRRGIHTAFKELDSGRMDGIDKLFLMQFAFYGKVKYT